tara:strand:+ start:1923 stop:2159 length:237 start_codon:yes stop_codon:yes gene_type:complete
MDMVMRMHLFFCSAIGAYSEVLFTVITHYTVYLAIFTKPVKHPVNSGAVHLGVQAGLDHIVAHGVSGCFQQVQDFSCG